jgi:NAD(P)-dependent dehydrogenase (short-subunit alcohol dehydrogenase family)
MRTQNTDSAKDAPYWVADLKERVVLVTGGGGGIGSALVRAFSQAGAKVAALDISGDAARAACADAPGASLAICADVSDKADVQKALEEVHETLGDVDILVNCAAVALKGTVVSLSVEDWDTTMRVNLRGVFLMCKAVLPGMIEREYGRIINFSSIDARKGRLEGGAYSTSKFGILGFTESLANEVTKHGITVNAVLPAGVATPMWARSHLDKDPGTVLAPEDLVDIVLFLASHHGRHISGASVDVFGKRLMTRTFQLG